MKNNGWDTFSFSQLGDQELTGDYCVGDYHLESLQGEQDTEEEQQEDEEAVIEEDDDEEDETEEIDPSRSEGLVQFAVKKFSELDRSTLSEPVLIRNLPWYVLI